MYMEIQGLGGLQANASKEGHDSSRMMNPLYDILQHSPSKTNKTT